jgi:hypothetical protein
MQVGTRTSSPRMWVEVFFGLGGSAGDWRGLPYSSALVLAVNVIQEREVHRRHWLMQPADGVDKTWGLSRIG